MGDELAGIEEDVKFNWDGAARLERELRSTATTLDSQIPRRNGYASDAREEWRGLYSRQFVGRMEICSSDARRLSSAMELAARQVEQLAVAARREQDRREAAREWKREQDNESLLNKGKRLPLRRGRQATHPAARPPAEPAHAADDRHGPGVALEHELGTAGRPRAFRGPQSPRRRWAARPRPPPAQRLRRLQ